MTNLHPTISMMCATHPQFYADTGEAESIVEFRPSSCIFMCPTCGTPKQVAHIKMVRGLAWNTLLCTSALCHRKASSPKWLCNCGKRWQSCPSHGPIGFTCGLPKIGHDQTSSNTEVPNAHPAGTCGKERSSTNLKRKPEAFSRVHDPRKMRRATGTAVPWFPNLPSKLPPKLAARFAHLYGGPPDQDPEFQDPNASSSIAPQRQSDPG